MFIVGVSYLLFSFVNKISYKEKLTQKGEID